MKLLLSLLVIALLSVSVLSQTRKAIRSKSKRPARAEKPVKTANLSLHTVDDPPPPKPIKREPLTSDVFRDLMIGKWGVAGFRIPRNLRDNSPVPIEDVTQNDDVSWTNYYRSWALPSVQGPPVFEVNLSITTWNRSNFSFVQDLKPDLATPENLVLLDIFGDLNNPDVKESRALDIDGVKGGFFLAYPQSVRGGFMVGWYTYRYFEGKVQRISLSVTGRKNELAKAIKIIQSLKIR